VKNSLIVAVAVGLFAGTLPINRSAAATIDDVLARVEKLEKENRVMRQENASIRRENLTLRNRMRRLEAGTQTASVAPQSAAPASVALARGASYAASAPVYKTPPLTAGPKSWTGFYIGGQVGAGRSIAEPFLGATALFAVPPTPPFFQSPVSSGLDGVFGGGQIGGNYQIGPLVLGLEGELIASNSAGTQACWTSGVACNSRIKSVSTVTGRVGGAVDNALVYIRGGIARAKYSFELDIYSSRTIPTNTVEATPRGWIGGAGIEYGFSPNWSGTIEYDYLSFDAIPVFFSDQVANAFTGEMRHLSVQFVKAGVNYKLY
jgi:outer membrane immunogenic protein